MKPSITDSTADLAYQKAILSSVSRTFALTIPLLPPQIEKVIGNTYLLCRTIDTIEDATELTPSEKQDLSQLFLDTVLAKRPDQAFVETCLQSLKHHTNQDELDLIAHTPTVLRILYSCSLEEQAAVYRCITIMSTGMSYFHGKQGREGLEDLREFEKYCYVVAGVVGELLTAIFSAYSPAFKQRIQGHEQLAISFGQALQMTNILKDAEEDKARGVSWKPAQLSQKELLQIAYQKLQDALAYILLIPKEEIGIRRFCFLAFGLSTLNLNKLAHNLSSPDNSEVKLTRKTVEAFYLWTKLSAGSNLLVSSFFYAFSSNLRRL
ncbi:farnesyl-diphosphate farnesyltransferase [Polynucleobacter meluiroseus]|uniref:Farnesyl-diphosphate farnesyltransferase n=1 Tax=Polynucleobacter meluiroseus TaxID=1938814 RepID=A0A240E0L5_9BURK|nr:squalene/phytoene synthase family protein [Polynucleobacter meluiroseus]SNX28985.1 farnesyl-diphosphate farnesyltransferase [Polynucleobacter meluiroseus]